MTNINVDPSWQPFHVTIKTPIGAVFVVDLEDVDLNLYGGEDGQEFSLSGRTVAPRAE